MRMDREEDNYSGYDGMMAVEVGGSSWALCRICRKDFDWLVRGRNRIGHCSVEVEEVVIVSTLHEYVKRMIYPTNYNLSWLELVVGLNV